MYKRIVCLMLAIVMILGVFVTSTEQVFASTGMTISNEGIAYLKRAEGFSKVPYWDASQWTVGYGTRCPDNKLEEYKKNGISEADAEKLFKEFITSFEYYVNKFVDENKLTVTQNQFDMLVCFSYNVGPAWMFQNGSLRKAILNNASDEVFVQELALWSKTLGSTSDALVKRRIRDANMWLNGDYTTKTPENIGYVYYCLNGGNIKNSVQTFIIRDGEINIKPLSYEADGFLGWYTLPSGGVKVEALSKDLNGKTLFARWEKDEITKEEENVEKEPVEVVTVTVTGDEVNLREGPGTNYMRVGTAKRGDTLDIIQTCRNLGRDWGESEKGWICLEYTTYGKSSDEIEEESKEPETTPETTLETKPEDKPVEESKPEEDTSTTEPSEPENTAPNDTEDNNQNTEPPVVEEEKPAEPPKEETEQKPEEKTPPTEPEKTTQTGIVKVSDLLRIRNHPGKSGKIVGHLKNGDKIEIFETKDADNMTWGRIGENQWTSLSYVKLVEEGKEEEPEPPKPEVKPEKVESEKHEVNGLSGSVTAKEALRIREAAGTHNKTIGYYGTNDRVNIKTLQSVGSTTWGKTDSGWISLDYVRFNVSGTIKADCLRIRHGAGTNNMIIGFYYNGASVRITEIKLVNDVPWGKTDKGWISMEYVVTQ